MKDEDSRVLVAIGEHVLEHGPKTVVIAVPRPAYDAMKGGYTQTIDLTSQGIPVQIILFGAEDHAEAMTLLHRSAAALTNQGRNPDGSWKDLSIPDPTNQ